MMTRELFTKEEALARVGRRVKSKIEFLGIPKGTTGNVVKADPYLSWEGIQYYENGYTLAIEWDLDYRLPSGQGLRDWFTKNEYEAFLEEI